MAFALADAHPFLCWILVARLTCRQDEVLSLEFDVDMSSHLCLVATVVDLASLWEVSACLSLPVSPPVAGMLA